MNQPVAPAKPKRGVLKKTGIGCGGLVVLFLVLVVIVGVSENGSKPAPAANASPVPAATPFTTPAHTLAPQANRDSAAAVLHASVDHYRQEFRQGQAIIGNTQYTDPMAGLAAFDDPTSAAARFRGYRQNPDPERDLSSGDAFKKADSNFTADNEPQAISDWQNDMGDASTALNQWVSTAVEFQTATKTHADLDAAASKVDQALAKADSDAEAVRNG